MSHCPDPETLAAFLDGGVSSAEREEVEKHAAQCDRCYFVLRETRLFQDQQQAPDRRRRLLSRLTAAAVLALLLGTSAFWILREPPTPRETIAAALEDTDLARRSTFGRTSLDVSWAPWQGVERSRVDPLRDPGTWQFLGALRPSRGRHAEETERLTFEGLTHLILGQGEAAAESLESALAIGEPDPATLSDLAAAYLQIGVDRRDPEAPHRALRWATRALELDADLPEAAFNRALALETQGLVGQAAEAWRRYLEIDPDSSWAQEARNRLEGLETASESSEVTDPPSSGDLDSLRQWSRREPQAARERLQRETMPEWGALYLAGGDEHRSRLAEASILAAAIADHQRDASFAEEISRTERLVEQDPSAARREARAHVAFGEGWRALISDPEESARQLALAADLWNEAGSSWEPWARVWEMQARHFVGRRSVGELRIAVDELRTGPEAARSPLLRGRAAWLSGVLAIHDLRYDLAIPTLREAFDTFDAARERDHASFVAFLVAESYSIFGDPTSAWEWIERSLALGDVADPGSRYSRTLVGVATIAAKADEPEAALAFVDEGLALAMETPSRIDGLRYRAKLLARLGRFDRATTELETSLDLLETLEPSPVRDRLAADLLLDRAEITMLHDPEAGQGLVRAARRAWGDRDLESRILLLDVLEAELALAEGDLEGALASLDRAEKRLAGLPGIQAMELPDRARRVFERILEARWARDADPEATLGIADAARRFGDERGVETGDMFSTARGLPPEVRTIYFEVLPSRTLAWVVGRGRTEAFELPLARPELGGLVLAIHSELVDGSPETALGTLSRHLRPVLEEALRGGPSELVIVPDEQLHELPFSMLTTPDGRAPLGSGPVVSIAFDLGFAHARRAGASASSGAGTLVVADPKLDETLFPRLAPLPHARQEAASLLRRDPEAELLTGATATTGAFVRLAPGKRLIHLATHAVPDSRRPWRSLLPLASSPDESPLHASSIADLPLAGTELVVLSSCGSARSVEGVGGLARGFLEAGAGTVIGARWPVRDRAAAELLDEFYERYFAGESPARALQAAQRVYRERHRDDPLDHTWAAFQLFRAS